MSLSPNLLLFCEDLDLLDTRRKVLNSAHFDVETATSAQEFSGQLTSGTHFDLAIICHSADQPTREWLQDQAQRAGIPVFQIVWVLLPAELITEVQRAVASAPRRSHTPQGANPDHSSTGNNPVSPECACSSEKCCCSSSST